MNQTNNNGRIAGVHVATLLRNLEDSTINEGSHDLFCWCKDAFAVLDSLLSEDGSRAAGLAEAAGLVSTIMADTFKRDDCSEEFLNGMAYGVASYCSAIKALAVAQPVEGAVAPVVERGAENEVNRPQTLMDAGFDGGGGITPTAQPAPMDDELPVLPAQERIAPFGRATYTAEQMRDYARTALRHRPILNMGGDVEQTKALWHAALADAAMYVEAHCVDGERHAQHIMEQPLPKIRAQGAAPGPADTDLLSALLWLYRRLPRGFGRQDHIEQPIKALAAQTGTDVAADLAERGRPLTGTPARAIDTFAGQPFAIVHGYRMEDDQPALACFTGSAYEFADGDLYKRAGDTLAGFPAEFLTLFQLEQRIVAATVIHQAQAWVAVCKTLTEVQPGWANSAGRGDDAAVATIRDLAERAQGLHTNVRAVDVARVLSDLDRVGENAAADAGIAGQAAAVIRGLLNGLSASQLAGVAGPADGQRMEEVR